MLMMTLAQATAQRRQRRLCAAIELIMFFSPAYALPSTFCMRTLTSCGKHFDPCQLDAFLVNVWLAQTLEFHVIVVALS